MNFSMLLRDTWSDTVKVTSTILIFFKNTCHCDILLYQTENTHTKHNNCVFVHALSLPQAWPDYLIICICFISSLTCLFSFIRTQQAHQDSRYSVSVYVCACVITRLEETDTAPLPWRRPIWQEPKRCWRDHCHLGPNEIQLSPNVRQGDSKWWATWQAARQPGRQTQTHTYI